MSLSTALPAVPFDPLPPPSRLATSSWGKSSEKAFDILAVERPAGAPAFDALRVHTHARPKPRARTPQSHAHTTRRTHTLNNTRAHLCAHTPAHTRPRAHAQTESNSVKPTRHTRRAGSLPLKPTACRSKT